jgi:NADPH:quinone reductase-like Zn-dependent oxidoreductase
MKAISLNDFGGTEVLGRTEVPVPMIGPTQVLVQLKSLSINPVDVKTRAGKGLAGRIKDQLPVILGWDISGVVVETGTEVNTFKTGDEVFGMVAFPKLAGAYAEFVASEAADLALKPANISHNEAAAATLAALTAWQALYHNARIQPGQRVLIHAAAGGVGHYAVQIAKHLGAYVIGTSSAENRDFVLSLGADEHIDYKARPFEEAASDLDFVLDAIGGEYIDRSLKVIKKGGTIISIPSGLNETVTEKATALGINGYFILVHPSAEDMASVADLLEKGILKSHVSKLFSFDDMAAAHLQIESGRTVGKVALEF